MTGARAASDEAVGEITHFQQVRPVRLYQRIVEQIEDALASGDLKPGQRLPSERELVTQFGASRSTVREALRIVRSEEGDRRRAALMANVDALRSARWTARACASATLIGGVMAPRSARTCRPP